MAGSPIRIRSTPSLETRTGSLGNPRWMKLLAAIERHPSITAAAKAVGLSYKAAWDAIDAMNNLSEQPLVLRSKGGKGGGGTRLTARGRRVVETFRAVEDENARFVELLNRRVRNADQDLRLIGRMTMLTSARNHFAGKVVSVRKGAVNDQVELELSGGDRIVAIITHESAENLGLKRGSQAVALVKASWVIVGVDEGPALKLSARNQLRGVISRQTPGAVNTEVVIELKGGNSVAAIITNDSVKLLKLAVGKSASAIFKASSVILGVSG